MKAGLIGTTLCAMWYLSPALWANPVVIQSPDKGIVCTVRPDPSGHLSYAVTIGGKQVLLPSPMGVVIDDNDLGNNAKLGKASFRTVKEIYPTRGVHSVARNHFREAVIPVSGGIPQVSWSLEVRVFPDAVAYRYCIPGQEDRKINRESSGWQLLAGTVLWYQSNAKKDYEMPFSKMVPDTLNKPMQIMTTGTFKLPEGLGYAKITEANLINYSDMALETRGNGLFQAFFHNSTQGWMHSGMIVSPWRVLILAKDLNNLVNTDVLHNLCPAPDPALANAPWIKPGKSTWHWMVTGSPNLTHQKQWIDWTGELGFDYYLIDDGWKRWSQQEKDQWACLKNVTEYATSKGVKIWAWVNSNEVFTEQQRNEYFARIKAAGVVGIKVDFMKPADPEWVNWYDAILSHTAKEHLMINFHGALKPTGRERTWPNELTREAIRGREMSKQPALHDVTLPFTRFVQGHADYTPTDFRADKLKGSTWTHELGMAIVYTSPFFCFSGPPAGYLESEALELMKALPAEWDETIVLPGSSIGEIAAFARRKGDEWYIGVINGNSARLDIDLKFLAKGLYSIEEFADNHDKPDGWLRKASDVSPNTVLNVSMSRDGGYVAHIKKK